MRCQLSPWSDSRQTWSDGVSQVFTYWCPGLTQWISSVPCGERPGSPLPHHHYHTTRDHIDFTLCWWVCNYSWHGRTNVLSIGSVNLPATAAGWVPSTPHFALEGRGHLSSSSNFKDSSSSIPFFPHWVTISCTILPPQHSQFLISILLPSGSLKDGKDEVTGLISATLSVTYLRHLNRNRECQSTFRHCASHFSLLRETI
jgi:hypothetical protein